jgi:hypothetical protein
MVFQILSLHQDHIQVLQNIGVPTVGGAYNDMWGKTLFLCFSRAAKCFLKESENAQVSQGQEAGLFDYAFYKKI